MPSRYREDEDGERRFRTAAEFHARFPETSGNIEADMADTPERKGALEARTRLKGIILSPDAVGREALANHLAFGTELSLDEVLRLLQAAPKPAVVAPIRSLRAEMAAMRQPNLGPGIGGLGSSAVDPNFPQGKFEEGAAAAAALLGKAPKL